MSSSTTSAQPRYARRIEGISAAAFFNENDHPSGVNFEKSYKDKDGQWITQKMSLFPGQIPVAIAVLQAILDDVLSTDD